MSEPEEPATGQESGSTVSISFGTYRDGTEARYPMPKPVWLTIDETAELFKGAVPGASKNRALLDEIMREGRKHWEIKIYDPKSPEDPDA